MVVPDIVAPIFLMCGISQTNAANVSLLNNFEIVATSLIALLIFKKKYPYKLLSYPKKTFTRQQLMDEFWDSGSAASSRTVDVYMTRLRDKLSQCDDFEIYHHTFGSVRWLAIIFFWE